MTEEQKALFDKLKTDLRQKTALNKLAGMSPADAHREAGGKCKNESDRRKLANEILSNPDVEDFLEAMKVNDINDAIMSREEMMKDLSLLSRANVAEPDEMTLAMLTELKAGFDIKLKSMKQLADLAGYEAPKEVVSKSLVTEIPADMSPSDAAKAYQDMMGA